MDEIEASINEKTGQVNIINEFSNEIISSFEEKNITAAKAKRKAKIGLEAVFEDDV